MDPRQELDRALTRRTFLARSGISLGGLGLASLLGGDLSAGEAKVPHFAPKAKRVIYLFMSGGPSHLDLFDPKPKLTQMQGKELPASLRKGQKVTAATARQGSLPLVPPVFPFVRRGKSGVELAEALPHTGGIVDDIAIVRSAVTDYVNHDPAVTFLLTGGQQPGRPTLGSWLSYGLGSVGKNLPEYVVLVSGEGGQPLRARYWGNGFLPSSHQGVPFRSAGDPVLYVSNPEGMSGQARREMLDGLHELNRLRLGVTGDPEVATRIGAYEMAYRMQTSVPELMDISREPKSVLEMYGAEPGRASFANNCLLARRLAERDVRLVQLYHRDWDHHTELPQGLRRQCKLTDRPCAALVRDLKQRGLLDSTLVVWAGEFGRTAYKQGTGTPERFGRDHHAQGFTVWLAGGGVKPGLVLGKTDDFGFHAVEDKVHVHDLQATILHCLGLDHKRLTYRSQGRDFRLTDVGGRVVTKLLA